MMISNNKLLYIFTFIFGALTSFYLAKKGFFDIKIESHRLSEMSTEEVEETKKALEKMGYSDEEVKEKMYEIRKPDEK